MVNFTRKLGVHTSIAGGIELSLERARGLGCNTMQIFSHNPRQWMVKDTPKSSVDEFKRLRRAYDIGPVCIHTSYLINLAAADKELLIKSIGLLIREMELADVLEADYVILHTGSASGDTPEAGRERAIEALKEVSDERAWKAKLLLENTAGERGDISSRMNELAEIIHKTDRELIGGVCIDTCHAFAAGYDITQEKGLAGLAEEITRNLGPDSVKLIHLNDSKKGAGSHVDRHEHIGEGGIGEKGLKDLINHPVFKNTPLILETPKKSDDDDKRNLETVKRLLDEKGTDLPISCIK